MTLSEKIFQLRRQCGLSQEELAERLNVSRQAISRWENGSAQPDASNLWQISRFFSVSADDLLDDAVTLPKEEESDNHTKANTPEKTNVQLPQWFQPKRLIALLLLGGAGYLAIRLLSLFLPYLAYKLGIMRDSTIFQLIDLIGEILLLIALIVVGVILLRKSLKTKHSSK